MFFTTVCLLLILFSVIKLNNGQPKDPDKWGPYDLAWTDYVTCHGPKSRNLTSLTIDITKSDNDYIAHFNFEFLSQGQIDEIKLTVYTLKDNKKTPLWSYNLKKPCQNVMFGEVIEKYLKGRNCMVNKGQYNAEVNFTQMTKTLLGPSFYYGVYILKSYVMSKTGNILCLQSKMLVNKKAVSSKN